MECPRCHKELKFEKERLTQSMIKCIRCNNEFINEDIDLAYGVRRVVEMKDGVETITYENEVDNIDKFLSAYCLKQFDTYEERNTHDKKYHKVGDFMVCCIPSGFPVDFKPECGS